MVIQDADLEYSPEEYPQLIELICQGHADVVFGSRFLGRHRVFLFTHYLGNRVLTLATNVLYNTMLTDMETCYKVMRADVLRSMTLKSNGFGIEPEITAKIFKRGYRVYEVPITYAGRGYEEGKKITWHAGVRRALGAAEVPLHRLAPSPDTVKIALLQINPTVGDLAGNARLIAEAVARGGAPRRRPRGDAGARAGRLPAARSAAQRRLRRAAAGTRVAGARARAGRRLPPVLVGLPEPNPSDEGRPLFNSAVLLRGGEVEQRFRKALLPTYDVFDEDRYFEPFHGPQLLELGGMRLGISICEDVWNDRDFWKRRRYHHDPIEELVRAGAQAIVNLSASPFSVGKHQPARGDAGQHGAQASRAGRLRQPVRRQRRPRVRRPQLRVQRRRRADRPRPRRSTPTS